MKQHTITHHNRRYVVTVVRRGFLSHATVDTPDGPYTLGTSPAGHSMADVQRLLLALEKADPDTFSTLSSQ